MPKYNGTIEERFWSKVDKNGPIPPACPELGPCWVWMAYKNRTGYGYFRVVKMVQAHRIPWEWRNGVIPDGLEPDHICHNTSCVNDSHIRLAKHIENVHNAKLRFDNTTGYKGVKWHSQCQKWEARISNQGKQFYLGLFVTPEDAHAAYCEAARLLHGEFANFGDHPA